MEGTARPRLFALGAAALFSTGGTAIKFCSFSGWQVACLRCAVGAAAIALFLPQARRAWTWRAAVVACAWAFQSLLFATSNKLTTAANAIFLQSTAPLYVLALSPWLLKERIRGSDVAFLAALGAGMACFFVGAEPARATATDPVLGNLLAAASGVGWALTVLGLRWLGRGHAQDLGDAALQATLLGNVLAFAVSAPTALPVPVGTLTDWTAVAFLGVFQIGLAYVCLTRAARGLRAIQVSLLLLLEPVLSAIWAWLVHGETPGPWSFAGMATILAATALHARLAR